MKTYQMFIGGQWVDALSGETFDDMNPYTGELYGRVAKGDTRDVDRVMTAAYAARKAMGGRGGTMRGRRYFLRLPSPRGPADRSLQMS